MSVTRISAYDEVIDFLTSEPTPAQIIAFRPSPAVQERINYLLEANRNGTLSPDEQRELDEFEEIEHLMRRLKIRAPDETQGPMTYIPEHLRELVWERAEDAANTV